MAKDRKTGLGTSAFFQQVATPTEEPAQPEVPSATGQGASTAPAVSGTDAKAATEPKKVRTTVMLYPETLAALEMLKVQARRRGTRATYSDILEEAIQALAVSQGVEV
jgi:hypothetical protein